MTEHLLDINGTRLFVDVRGDENAPPVLFIHGGPGQSCFDFCHAFEGQQSQADHLAKNLRVIALDQRGILRSDPLPDGYAITPQVLVDDFEAIREHLGIAKWAIIGHSAGGSYAIRYAHGHPDTVSAAVYDCPAFDSDLTDRYRLPIAATLLDETGDHASAEECRAFATRETRLTAADETYKPMQRLGERYNELFFHTPAAIDAYNQAQSGSGFTGEQWRRGMTHLPLLADMYDSKLPLLPELAQPSLLLHGRYDLVAAPAVIDAYREHAPQGRVHTLTESAHFTYIEQPAEYADVVSTFITSVG